VLNIISGLLVRVVPELKVSLLGELVGGGDTTLSLVDVRDSHEKALVSFLVVPVVGAEVGAGLVGALFFADVSVLAWGDHGIEGRELAMLLSDIVLAGRSFSFLRFSST
jgi:hypothetical protein